MSDDTKSRILAAALDLFSARGFAAVSTKAISAAAGVNEVTLFRLFSSKKNLYIEVFRRYSIPADDESIRSILERGVEADIGELARAIANLVLRNSKLVRMSIKDMLQFEEIDRELKQQPELLISKVAALFSEFKEKGTFRSDCDAFARVFVQAIFSTTIHFVNRGAEEIELDDFLRTFSLIFSRGVRT